MRPYLRSLIILLTVFSTTGKAQDNLLAKRISVLNGVESSGPKLEYDIDSLGNFYIAGRIQGVIDFDPSLAVYNVTGASSSEADNRHIVAKYNINGDLIWLKQFAKGVSISDIAVSANGFIYLTGIFKKTIDFDFSIDSFKVSSFDTIHYDIFYAKYDTDADLVWVNAIKGMALKDVRSIDVDTGGNVYLAGTFHDNVDFDPSPTGTAVLSSKLSSSSIGEPDLYIAKYNPMGNYVWVKQLKESKGTASSLANHIEVKCYISGIIAHGFFVDSLDLNPGAGVNYIVTDANPDNFIAKYDFNGNFSWGYKHGVTFVQDLNTNVFIDSVDNVYLICDVSQDVKVVKYSPSGTELFSGTITGPEKDVPGGIVVDQFGNIVVSGFFKSTADFDFSAGVKNVTSSGAEDMFIAYYSPDFKLLSVKKIGGVSGDQIYDISKLPNGDILVYGTIMDSVGFVKDGSVEYAKSAGLSDQFFAVFTKCALPPSPANTSSGQPICKGNQTQLSANGSGTIFWYASLAGGASIVSGNTFTTPLLTTGTTYYAEDSISCGISKVRTPVYKKVLNPPLVKEGLLPGKAVVFDPQKKLQWIFQLTGNGTQRVSSSAIDKYGNIYVSGDFTDTVDFDPSPAGTVSLIAIGNYQNSYLAKYFSDGSLSWARRISRGELGINKVLTDDSGNVYLAGKGEFYSSGFGATFGNHILKFSPDGVALDSLYFSSGHSQDPAELRGFAMDSDGNLIMAGVMRTTIDFDPSSNVFNLTSGTNINDLFIAKYNRNLDLIWAGILNKANTSAVLTAAGLMTLDNDIYLYGSYSGTVDFNPGAGNNSLTSTGGTDGFILKLNTSGNFIWVKEIASGSGNSSVNGLSFDKSGKMISSGQYTGTADIDPGSSQTNIVSAGDIDLFMLQTDTACNLIWNKTVGGSGAMTNAGLMPAGENNYFIWGTVSDTTDFDAGSGISNMIGRSSYPVSYLAKYDMSGNLIRTDSLGKAGMLLAIDTLDHIYVANNTLPQLKIDTVIINSYAMDGFFGKYKYYDSLNIICQNDAPFKLSGGTPAGGLFSAFGVVNDTFYSSIAGVGYSRVNYQYTDPGGCYGADNRVVRVGNSTPITITASGNTTFCAGDSVVLSTVPASQYTYQWLRNDTFVTGSVASLLAAKVTGGFKLQAIETGKCASFSNTISVVANPLPQALITSNKPKICLVDTMQLLASSPSAIAYLWYKNNAPLIADTFTTRNVYQPDSFSVRVTDANGCKNFSPHFVVKNYNPPFVENICVVTTDSATGKNVVVWEKTADVRTVAYQIYREGSISGQYTLLASIPYNQLSLFLDTGSNPLQQSYRYAITTLDSCGAEALKGVHHKTVHLSANTGINGEINLLWNAYEGITYTSHKIYRSVNNGAYNLIAQVPSGTFSYSDLTPPVGNKKYYVEIVLPDVCTATQLVQTFVAVQSNKISLGNVSLSELNEGIKVQLYPNPFNSLLQILSDAKMSRITIHGFDGRLVYQNDVDHEYQTDMDLGYLQAGVYFVEVKSEKGIYYQKLIKR